MIPKECDGCGEDFETDSPEDNYCKKCREPRYSPNLKSKDVQKPKVVILDDNELSVAMYAEEYPENFKAITSNLKAKDVQEASQ